jgi:Zn-dependent peptidase ImmA (M78 family)
LVRQRFTIAHEVGHLLLHGRDDLHVDRDFRVHRRDDRSSQAIDAQEIAANAFAAELLMPTVFMRAEVSGAPVAFDDDARVQDLARTFEVSVQAMVIRLTNIRLLASPAEPGVQL